MNQFSIIKKTGIKMPSLTSMSVVLIAAICFFSQPSFSESGLTATEVTIGMSNVLTGPTAALAIGMKLGAEAFFEKLNKDGGVAGRK